MKPHFISPKDIQIATEVLQWARDYLMKEEPLIKRPGGSNIVCPFVGPAIENDSFYLAFHPEVNGESEEHIEVLMHSYLGPFKSQGPFGQNDKQKKALVVVFPNIPNEETKVLDIAHQNIKSKFVIEGLMLGQFHKNCDERGIYNEGFQVSIAPHPLMAVRHMSVHDILFLGDNEHWFNEYNMRFGEKFKEPKSIEDYNKHLLPLYLKARKKFLK